MGFGVDFFFLYGCLLACAFDNYYYWAYGICFCLLFYLLKLRQRRMELVQRRPDCTLPFLLLPTAYYRLAKSALGWSDTNQGLYLNYSLHNQE